MLTKLHLHYFFALNYTLKYNNSKAMSNSIDHSPPKNSARSYREAHKMLTPFIKMLTLQSSSPCPTKVVKITQSWSCYQNQIRLVVVI